MYDDFLVVRKYGKLYAKFLLGTLRRWNFWRIFDFLLEQVLEFVLMAGGILAMDSHSGNAQIQFIVDRKGIFLASQVRV